MCAEFIIKARKQKLERALGIPPAPEDDELDWDRHVRLYGYAPVVVLDENQNLKIEQRQFSLKPPGTKFSTFNARLSSWDDRKNKLVKIFEKPTWRKPFESGRCLIPLTSFIEPLYTGEFAGQAMAFSSQDDEAMFVAGLYEDSVDPKTGEVYEGFALVLHTPSPLVLEMGHHRQVVSLNKSDALAYLHHSASDDDLYEFLRSKREFPALNAKKSRDLAKGWEKRIADHEKKHQAELDFLKKTEKA